MAIYRNVQMAFWTDPDVADEYTPNDKLFYIYVLTNPHTNLSGCYEISTKQMANELGFSVKEVNNLIKIAEESHKTIIYSRETKELLILKWNKYNWTESEKFRKPLLKEIQSVKNDDFRCYLMDLYNGIDTVSIRYPYGIDTTVTDTVTVTDINSNKVKDSISDKETDLVNRVIEHLNAKCGTHYKPTTENTRKYIRARLKDGYNEDDLYAVIDKKAEEWLGTEQERYLRPETLFGAKFESYLNQNIRGPGEKGGNDGGDVSGGESPDDFYKRYLSGFNG